MSKHRARFAVFNIAAVSLLVAAWATGMIAKMLAADASHLTLVILAVFAGSWVHSAIVMWRLDRDLPENREARRWALDSRIDMIDEMSALLVRLGFIGTIVGFLWALAGIDVTAIGNAEAAAGLAGQMMVGMAIALHTTLAGLVFGRVWLRLNFKIAEHAAHELGR